MERSLLPTVFLVAYSLIVPSSTCFQVLNIQFFEGLMTLILERLLFQIIWKARNLKWNAVGVRPGSTPSNYRTDFDYFPFLFGNKNYVKINLSQKNHLEQACLAKQVCKAHSGRHSWMSTVKTHMLVNNAFQQIVMIVSLIKFINRLRDEKHRVRAP